MAADPRHLQILLEISRAGSFSGAAALRNVSQPAISIAIAQLERQMGALLLERNRRGVSLTPAGAILARRAEVIEQQLLAAEQEVRLAGSGIDGPLVIGGTPGALASLVPCAIQRLSASGRALSLRVVEASDGDLNEMLRAGKIDLALTSVGVDPLPAGLEELPIQEDAFEVVVAPDNPLSGAEVDLADLTQEPWVLPNAAGVYRRQVEALFFSAQVETPRNVVRCDSLATAKALVRLTRYITVWPRDVVAGELECGLLRSLAIRGHSFSRKIGVRQRGPADGSPLSTAFVAALQDAVEL